MGIHLREGLLKNDHMSHIVSLANQNLKKGYLQKKKNFFRISVTIFDCFQSEDLDLNADIHGNWTLENAKSRLHQFIQMNKMQTDYKYSMVGPDHNRYTISPAQGHSRDMFCLSFGQSSWLMLRCTILEK